MTFAEAVHDLEKRSIMPEKAPNLESTREGLALIGFYDWLYWQKNKDNPSSTIVVAGTNGKGSTCAALEALFLEATEVTGFYSSPHLAHYCERFRYKGENISEALFATAYEDVSQKTISLPLTHFEILTLMAVWIFCSGKALPIVDRLILEVGLGGLWDATNAIPHKMSVIATIDYDHQNLLGKSLPEIARNKLGIVEDNSLVVHHPFPAEIETVVQEKKSKVGGVWIKSQTYPYTGSPGRSPEFFLQTPWGETKVSLPGKRGAENISLALTAFSALKYDPSKYISALSRIKWPGRMNLLGYSHARTPVYLSGDHNPQGVKSLLELLTFYKRENLFIIAALGKDKDRDGILKPLFEIPNSKIILTQTKFRFLKLNEYGPWLKKALAHFESLKEALDFVCEKSKSDDLILVTGSLYLVGELMTFWHDYEIAHK